MIRYKKVSWIYQKVYDICYNACNINRYIVLMLLKILYFSIRHQIEINKSLKCTDMIGIPYTILNFYLSEIAAYAFSSA